MTDTVQAQAVSDTEIFTLLNKLKKSSRNVRKVPLGEAVIEALAASIAIKGMIQYLIVEPELKDGAPTGSYFVTAGEGRRQAQLLHVKCKQISKTGAVRCYLAANGDRLDAIIASCQSAGSRHG